MNIIKWLIPYETIPVTAFDVRDVAWIVSSPVTFCSDGQYLIISPL
jgi:hypothetical protein